MKYYLSIFVAFCLLTACSKKKVTTGDLPTPVDTAIVDTMPQAAKELASEMIGMRKWKVVYFMTRGSLPDTLISLPDTNFSISLPSIDTMVFAGAKMPYSSYEHGESDTSNVIGYKYINNHVYNSAKFYFTLDSIVIRLQDGGLGGYYYIEFTTIR